MKRPNIIYIHTHDSGRLFSPYGYKVPTKHIEAFAQDAVLFRNAFAAAPTCSPSRSALLTGRYPHSNGMLGLSNRGFALTDYSEHLVPLLNENGYATVLCGIQHEAAHFHNPDIGGNIIGYQENITTGAKLKQMSDKRSWDSENCERVCSFIRNYRSSKPYFLSFGMFCTHRPYPAETPADAKSIRPPGGLPDIPEVRKDFAGHCESLKHADSCFGMVIEALKQSGSYQDSIILFTTDHGIAFPFSKSTLFDSGIAVALMMRVPWSQATGVERNGLVSHIDVVPTLCDLLDIAKPKNLQGRSFADLFAEQNEDMAARDEVFAEMNFHTSFEPARCIRTKRYKYIEYLDREYTGQNLSNINESLTKTVFLENGLENRPKPMSLLFDLLYDPDEKNNLSGTEGYEAVENDLRGRLSAWRTETKDPLLSDFTWKKGWVVNKPESRVPNAKLQEDYVDGHAPSK